MSFQEYSQKHSKGIPISERKDKWREIRKERNSEKKWGEIRKKWREIRKEQSSKLNEIKDFGNHLRCWIACRHSWVNYSYNGQYMYHYCKVCGKKKDDYANLFVRLSNFIGG